MQADVIKLDLGLVQGRTTAEIARTLGATMGQGWLSGRPGGLPEGTRPPRVALDLFLEPAAVEDQTPFEVVSAERVPERAPKDLLLPMSMHIEDKGLDAAEPGCCWPASRRRGTSAPAPGPGSGAWRHGRR